ncbi:MAG: glycosyltransferase [Chloroflexota bacterium]
MTDVVTEVLIVAPAFLEWDLGTYISQILTAQKIAYEQFAYRGWADAATANKALLEKAASCRPRYVIGLKMGLIEPETLAELRRQGAILGLWHVDCFDDQVPAQIGRLLPHLDAFFVTAKGMIPAYAAVSDTPVHWLVEGVYLPAFPKVVVPEAQRPLYESQVAFVGNLLHPPVADKTLAQRRLRLLAAISERHTLKIWGPQGDPSTDTVWDNRAPIIRWPAYHEELVKICSSSEVVLGINTINSVPQYFSNRTYLTLASGGFHLTHYVPRLEKMFINHGHLVWYHSNEECLDLIDDYLKRPFARQKIAKAGQAWVREKYSMDLQVEKMLDVLASVRK